MNMFVWLIGFVIYLFVCYVMMFKGFMICVFCLYPFSKNLFYDDMNWSWILICLFGLLYFVVLVKYLCILGLRV
jgi:TRAP-type uncharacterized transport system fused permease subunit